MGLFDLDMSTPQGQGFNNALLAAAQALLTPRSRGGGMGAAFGAFPQAIDRAKANAMREQLMALQEQQMGMQGQKLGFEMDEARRKADQDAQQRQLLARYASTLPPDQQQLAMLAPQEFLKTLMPQSPKLETIFDDQGREVKAWLRGPGSAPLPIGGAKQAQMPWEFETGPDGQPRMRPGVFDAKQRIAQAGAGKGVTFVEEKEENKAVGKMFGEQFGDIQKAGFSAQSKIARLDRLGQMLEGLQTGKLTPAMTNVKATLESLGISIDDKLGAAQAVEAISNELALQGRSTAGGAGMPGAMSDKDREFLVNTVPGLSKTPEGNRLLIETNRRLAKRDQDIAKLARDYRRQHKQLDEGFYDELQRFSDANPLFEDMAPSGPAPAGKRLVYNKKTGRVE